MPVISTPPARPLHRQLADHRRSTQQSPPKCGDAPKFALEAAAAVANVPPTIKDNKRPPRQIPGAPPDFATGGVAVLQAIACNNAIALPQFERMARKFTQIRGVDTCLPPVTTFGSDTAQTLVS